MTHGQIKRENEEDRDILVATCSGWSRITGRKRVRSLVEQRYRLFVSAVTGVALGVGLLFGVAMPKVFAQGSEPRLLIPLPGTTSSPTTVSPSPSAPSSTPGYTPAQPGYGSATPTPIGQNSLPAAGTASPATARLEVRMTQLEEDLRSVTGRLEEVSYQIRKLDDRLNKLASDVDYRLNQNASAGTDGGSASAGAGAGAAVASKSPATVDSSPANGDASQKTASLPTKTPQTPREQYAQAFSLMEKRNYSDAGAAFADFLKRYPDDPLADNARYWLGETYYARGDYAQAAEYFLDGYDKNRTGPKAPESLLKLGLSLSGLDKKKEACASFRELNRAFPNASTTIKDRASEESKRLGCN